MSSPVRSSTPLSFVREPPYRYRIFAATSLAQQDYRVFPDPARLSPHRQAVPEFETTAQGCRIATSVGGVLTGRGADIIIDDPLKP